jgi:hypothetical protein
MTLEITKELDEKIEEVSNLMNIKKEEFVGRAIQIYLDEIEKRLNLKREIKIWDSYSDEALLNFESSI